MNKKELIKDAGSYVFDESIEAKDIASRKEFKSRWPEEKLKDMNLEEYCGLEKDNFCYWLERKHILAGIGGGSAFKFGVYKNGLFYKRNGQVKKEITTEEANAEFQKIKNLILKTIDLAKLQKILEIESLEKDVWRMILLKIINIYVKDNFLTVLASKSLKEAAKTFEVMPENEMDKFSCIGLNYFLNKKINEIPEMSNWSDSKRGTFIWEKFADSNEEDDGDLNMVKIENNSKTPKGFQLNTIFYGPPGTGKTYETIYRALEILDKAPSGDKSSTATRHEAITKFKNEVKNGNILFITFNQSYSYEEFIEGIRPDIKQDERLVYKIEPGVLRAFLQNSNAENIFKIGDQVLSTQSQFIIKDVDVGNVILEQTKGKTDTRGLIYIPIKAIMEAWGLIETGVGTIEEFTAQDNQEIKKYITFDKYILGYRSEFRALLRYVESKKGEIPSKNPKVLVIDEINRGNVAQIFGELITLLEKDKREDGRDGVPVVLPYSKDNFILPNNFYVIGTMNTADKSVAPLDFALRRRFNFEAFWPDPKLIISNWKLSDVSKIEIWSAFIAINEKIEILKGKDFTLGHSYFLNIENIEELHDKIYQQIIPLLIEYFYEDWESLKFILGDGFIQKHRAIETFKSSLPDGKEEAWCIKDYKTPLLFDNKGFIEAFKAIGAEVRKSSNYKMEDK